MAGVDLRTVAELMGHSSIQMTMRYAHLAPQHNRAAVDRLVSLSDSQQATTKGRRAPKRKNELVTKSVTSETRRSGRLQKSRNKSLSNSVLQPWPRSSGG